MHCLIVGAMPEFSDFLFGRVNFLFEGCGGMGYYVRRHYNHYSNIPVRLLAVVVVTSVLLLVPCRFFL